MQSSFTLRIPHADIFLVEAAKIFGQRSFGNAQEPY